LQKSIWREGHRRSPRISQKMTASTSSARTSGRALATTRAQEMGNGQGATLQTRTTKKRKIRPVQEVAATSLSTRLQKVYFFLLLLFYYYFPQLLPLFTRLLGNGVATRKCQLVMVPFFSGFWEKGRYAWVMGV
jgi:hypothetical protein